MPFVHPAIFWAGLGAVAIPIIIHFLARRRFRIRDWAAMQFVREALRRQRRRLQIEQLILLLLRCLVVLLLAMAISRFTGCGDFSPLPGSESGRTTIFILDDSVSMGQKLGPTTAFDLATDDLAVQIEQLPEGETVAIWRSSDPDEAPWFDLNFVTDRESLVAKLRTLAPSDQAAEVHRLAARAAQALAARPGERRIVLMGDFRRHELTGEGGKALSDAAAAADQAGIDVIAMDYGQPGITNLTLVSLELVDKFVIAEQPARMAVTVRNNGQTTPDDVDLAISMRLPTESDSETAGQDVQLPAVELPAIAPGEQRRIEFEVVCTRTGPVALMVGLPADDLAG
ncbi:MAG: BatA domain-containing protein, partial [Planctomycetota bacterium]